MLCFPPPSPLGVPEQINLQAASPDTVVVSFVTFEESAPSQLPSAALTREGESSAQSLQGVTHTYHTPAHDRTYYMHFVKFSSLVPRTQYSYKVKSGGANTTWSGDFSFRSPYSSADGKETRVAIFGDMGVYTWNNMANMAADVADQEIDMVVHIGDHCYNIGGSDDRRGDGYMQAYQGVVGQVPWIPVVGNHEFYSGDNLTRYLNQTEGTVIADGQSKDHPWLKGSSSTADTALGAVLSTGNHHAAGLHGTTPSGTSRYFSVDLGLIHFVALDMNMYNAVDNCGELCRQSQLKWLRRDLEAAQANRKAVPWIVAMSHYPLYCSNCPKSGTEPGDWWNAEASGYAPLENPTHKPRLHVLPTIDGRPLPPFQPLHALTPLTHRRRANSPGIIRAASIRRLIIPNPHLNPVPGLGTATWFPILSLCSWSLG